MEMNRIYNMDCLEGMKKMGDNSVNLAILDLPYNIKKASWDKWKRQEDYISWCGEVLKEVERVLKDNGSLYFFHNDFLQMVEVQNWINNNSEFVFKSMITWEKYQTNKQYYGRTVLMGLNNTGKRNYFPMSEYILFYTFQDETGLTTVKLDLNNFTTLRQYFKDFQEALGLTKKQIIDSIGQQADHCFRWKSSQWDLPTEETYKQLCSLPLQYEFVRKEYEDLRKEYEDLRKEYEDLRKEYEDLRYTYNFVETDITRTWLYPPAKKEGHITQKPIDLIKNIILHSSNENDLILDPTMGSGTTAVSCIQTNRNFIGFELNEEYYNLAQSRIDKELNQEKLSCFQE